MPTMKEIALLCGVKLSRLVSSGGMFQYRYHSRTGEDIGGYNLVRHAGAVWAMYQLADPSDSPVLRGVLAQADIAGAALERFIFEAPEPYSGCCVVEGGTIKLGANALAALAYMSSPRTADRESARKMIQFMLSSDLRHEITYPAGRVLPFESDYYTGEALLALLTYAKVPGRHPDERSAVVAAVRRVFDVLPPDYGEDVQSHWMLYALSILLDEEEINGTPALFGRAQRIAHNIVQFPIYRAWGRSTPIACRIEGMLAFFRLLRKLKIGRSSEMREHVLADLIALEGYIDLSSGAVVRSKRSDEVRIDYIQHTLSAFWFGAQEFIDEEWRA